MCPRKRLRAYEGLYIYISDFNSRNYTWYFLVFNHNLITRRHNGQLYSKVACCHFYKYLLHKTNIFLFGLSNILVVSSNFGIFKTSCAKASYLVTLYTFMKHLTSLSKMEVDCGSTVMNTPKYKNWTPRTVRLNMMKVTKKMFFFEQKNHGLSVWIVPIKALF